MWNVDSLLYGVLALMMFGVGTSLKWKLFVQTFASPRALIVGIALQMLLLPCAAFALAKASSLPPSYQIGIFLLALCPGGSSSNFVSYLLDADVALSIGLTSLNSVLILVTLPVLLSWGLHYGWEAEVATQHSLWTESLLVLLIILFPALLGIVVRSLLPQQIDKWKKPIKYGSSLLLASVFAIKFFGGDSHGGVGKDMDIWPLLLWCLLLQIATMLITLVLSRICRFSLKSQVTMGIEVGLQNTGLALLLAMRLFEDPMVSHPSLLVGVFSFFSTLLLGYFYLRWMPR